MCSIVYKTPVRPVFTYKSESWSLGRKDENMLPIFKEGY
jgi:hypothetical protein